jgi:hypothetical protein
VQYQPITDTSNTSSIDSTMGILSGVGRVSNAHSRHGRFGRFPSQSQNRQRFNRNIPCRQNSGNNRPYIDYRGPCPVHPTLVHNWGDCINNPRNKSAGGRHGGQHSHGHDIGGRLGWGTYYSSCGGCGCGYHTPQIATPFPTLYMQQAPSNNALPDALSTVSNADTSSVIPNATYVIQQKPSS